MKVVFLDFDGVLNSDEWLAKGNRSYPGIAENFDSAAIAVLNEITDRSGAKIVVSSSWRKVCDLGDLRRILLANGVRAEVVGETPRLYRDFKMYTERPVRGDEIQAWLDERPCVTHFVILDDDNDMAHLSLSLVQTDCRVGLNPEHIDPVLKILEAE